MKRSCGILLPVFSLPSPYGIGTLGRAAFDFIDFLHGAGQSYWQILPVGQTSYGDSPYQCLSSFAGNPYLIDLDELIRDGLLTKEEVNSREWGNDRARVDYGLLFENRYPLLKLAAKRGIKRDKAALDAFIKVNETWLSDYALYYVLKEKFGMKAWTEWPEPARKRDEKALSKYREELESEIQTVCYIQFLFFGQWKKLREYAHSQNIEIIGDVPIYTAPDSSDVWADPESFQLDEECRPVAVAGVPPDSYRADGQLWGNPLYDYDAMEKDGFGWWIRRIDGAAKLYDVIRIDHFRGFESYWAVPAGEKTAINGKWVKGPGMKLLGVLKGWFPNVRFIAEDLGYTTAEVRKLLDDTGFPGMKILEFAFITRKDNADLPHNYTTHCVCYTGTHDNPPLAAWFNETERENVEAAKKYLGLSRAEGYNFGVIRGGMSSVAELFIAQMQDYLGTDASSRINSPGVFGGNWQWRMTPGQATDALREKIAEMAKLYGRSAL